MKTIGLIVKPEAKKPKENKPEAKKSKESKD